MCGEKEKEGVGREITCVVEEIAQEKEKKTKTKTKTYGCNEKIEKRNNIKNKKS